MHALKEGASRAVIERPVDELTPCPRNARTHSRKQLRQIANSIERFGFTNPVLIDDAGQIIAGHGRVEAAKLLGLKQVPTLTLSHLSSAERRAYMLADNKLALNAGWDPDLLAQELQELIDVDFDMDLTGFSLAEIDLVLDDAREASPDTRDAPEDSIPEPSNVLITERGDLWQLGEHYLLCGDARDPADFTKLMQGRKADLVFTDPP
jgi:ParB-like chromosome segregation protein Spo0J